MKISKLFHWLYAILMLLPIFAIGVTCAYAIFNKNAYRNYGDKYVENLTQITNANDFIENVNYKVIYNENLTNAGNQSYNVNSTSLNDYLSLQPTQYVVNITFLNDNGTPRIQYTLNDNTNGRIMNWQDICPTFVINLKSHANSYINTNFTSLYMINETISSISDVFYYSIDKVTQSPYFSWSYNSFLVTPFTYIVNLFGMPVDSPVVMLLSYWLDISIIWLVFDMVMYVPLLVHRWLDKGVLE